MTDDFSSFLDYRTTQRQLFAKFAHPRRLMLHTFAFIMTILLIWAYGTATNLWLYRDNFILPVLMGVMWSLMLAAHALLHYRRSASASERREIAVDETMKQYIEKHGHHVSDDSLFAMHREFESGLEQQGRWSIALTTFALVNGISWLVSSLNLGSSWPFQMTLPIAIVTIGGIYLFLNWRQQRLSGLKSWFVRLPMRHFAAYGAGIAGLVLAAGYRLINYSTLDAILNAWTLILVLHVVGAVVLWPVVERFLPDQSPDQPPIKRKVGSRLALADDGEMPDLDDNDSQGLQSSRF